MKYSPNVSHSDTIVNAWGRVQDEYVKIDVFFWFVKTFVLIKNFQSQVRDDGETTYAINEIGMGIVALRIWVKKKNCKKLIKYLESNQSYYYQRLAQSMFVIIQNFSLLFQSELSFGLSFPAL